MSGSWITALAAGEAANQNREDLRQRHTADATQKIRRQIQDQMRQGRLRGYFVPQGCLWATNWDAIGRQLTAELPGLRVQVAPCITRWEYRPSYLQRFLTWCWRRHRMAIRQRI